MICLNYLFDKGKGFDGEFLNKKFEELTKDNSTRNLIVNWQENENTSILSSYMKNRFRFPTYEELKTFTKSFFKEHEQTLRHTQYTYKQLLLRAIEESKPIEEINNTLVDAYEYFAKLYNRNDVIKNMSELYNLRLLLLSQEDYEKELDYAYENNTFKGTFSGYLDKLFKENSSYANGTFIYYALISMQDFNQDIYDKICKIAQRNHKGIYLEKLTTKELSKCVKDKLLKIEKGKGEIFVEEKILHNYSPIKLLLWLLQNNKIKYSDAEKYLQKHKNVEITQTYLNIAFKTISNEHYKDKDSKDIYSIMEKLWPDTRKNPTLYPSIEMLLAMIRITKKKEDLERVIKKFPEERYHNSPQFIDTLIRQIIYLYNNEKNVSITNLLKELKDIIIKYKNIINITIINSYLYGLITIWKGELNASDEEIRSANDTLEGCWEQLQSSNGKINIHQLLGINHKENSEIWEIEADVQTYTFFPMCDSGIIQLMNDKFNGNFYYDEGQTKCCLFDALKNYAFYINKNIQDTPNYKELSEIIERKEHKKTRYNIYEKIIFNNQKSNDDFWFKLLETSDLMCKEIIFFFKNNKIDSKFLENESKIDRLRNIYTQKKEQPNPSYNWEKFINEVYDKVSQKNKILYKIIFM